MFRNLKQKIGESLESSPARSLLQGKPENVTGSSPKADIVVVAAAAAADSKESPFAATHFQEFNVPLGVLDDTSDDDEIDPDYTSLGFDDLLKLYLTTRQRHNLYRSNCTKLFSSYKDLHAECNRLRRDISVEKSSNVKNEEECRSLQERVKQLETVLGKCKDTIRASKKQAQQSKDERDVLEKRLQAKSADFIVLQAQCDELKNKLNEAKELVAQSDTNLALAVAETKRSLHGALEARDDELVQCREALRLADLRHLELEQKVTHFESTDSEQIKQLEITIKTLLHDKQCIEEKLVNALNVGVSFNCQSSSEVTAKCDHNTPNDEANDVGNQDGELQRAVNFVTELKGSIDDQNVPPASPIERSPTTSVSESCNDESSLGGDVSDGLIEVSPTSGVSESRSEPLESRFEELKVTTQLEGPQSSGNRSQLNEEAAPSQDQPVSGDTEDSSIDGRREDTVVADCDSVELPVNHVLNEMPASEDNNSSRQESNGEELMATKLLRQDLATEIDKHLLQLENIIRKDSELSKDDYMSLLAQLRKTIGQAKLLGNNNAKDESGEWKIAKLEKAAVDAKVLVLRHEGEIMELHRRNIGDRAAASAQQVITTDHIKRLEGKMLEFAKAERLAKEQLVHFQNDEKLRTAAQNVEIQKLREEIEMSRMSESMLRQALEETKVRCEQQFAMTTAENMSALGQFTEFLQSNQSELIGLVSELDNARQQLAETSDELDERTYQLEDALRHIAVMEERLETSLATEDNLRRQLTKLDPLSQSLGVISNDALHLVSYDTDANPAVGEWPVRHLGVWFQEQGNRLNELERNLKGTDSADSLQNDTQSAQKSEIQELVQVENCQRLQMKAHRKPRTISHEELEAVFAEDNREIQNSFDAEKPTQCLDSLRSDLETLREQFVKQSEKLCLANDRLQTVSTENELLKKNLKLLSGLAQKNDEFEFKLISAIQMTDLNKELNGVERISDDFDDGKSRDRGGDDHLADHCDYNDTPNPVHHKAGGESLAHKAGISGNDEGHSSETFDRQLNYQLTSNDSSSNLNKSSTEEPLPTCKTGVSFEPKEVDAKQQQLDAVSEPLVVNGDETSRLTSSCRSERIPEIHQLAEKRCKELEDLVLALECKLNDRERELEVKRTEVECTSSELIRLDRLLTSQSEELTKSKAAGNSETQSLREDMVIKIAELALKDEEIEKLMSELKQVKENLQITVDKLDVKRDAIEVLETELRTNGEQHSSQISQLRDEFEKQLHTERLSLRSVAETNGTEIELVKQENLVKEQTIIRLQAELESRLAELQSEIDSREKMISALRQNNDDFVAELITKHENDSKRLESEFHSMKTQAEVFRETHEAVVTKYQAELQQSGEIAKGVERDHMLKTEDLQRTIAKQTADQENFVSQLAMKDHEIENLDSELKLVQLKLQTCVDELSVKCCVVESLKREIGESRENFELQIAQFKNELDVQVCDEQFPVRSVADSTSAELEITRREVFEKEETIKSLRVELEARIVELHSELESRDKTIHALQRERDDIVANMLSKHETEIQRLESEQSAARRQADVSREVNEAMVAKCQSELQVLEETCRVLKMQREESEQKMVNLMADGEAVEVKYRQRISDMEQGDAELNAQLVAVTEKLNSITEYTNSSEKMIENYQLKIRELTQRLEEMKQQLVAAETAGVAKDAEVRRELESLRGDLQAEADSRIAESAREIAALKIALENSRISRNESNEHEVSETSELTTDWESMCESETILESPEMKENSFETASNQTSPSNVPPAVHEPSCIDSEITDSDSSICITRLQSENVKLLERLTSYEATVKELNRRHKKEVEKLRSEYRVVMQEIEEQHNVKTVQLIKDFSTQLENNTSYADCCKKIEHRLMSEHRQQMTEVSRQLTDRDVLIQQYESDSQAAEADYQAELNRLNAVISDLQLELQGQRELVQENAIKVQSFALGYSSVTSDELLARGGKLASSNDTGSNTHQASASDVIQSLQIENTNLQARISRQADEVRFLKNRDRELQQQIESMRSSSRELTSQYGTLRSSSGGMLPEPTELEYLKNILYKYMLGTETKTLAKVICTVVKFSDEQTRKIMDREETKKEIRLPQIRF